MTLNVEKRKAMTFGKGKELNLKIKLLKMLIVIHILVFLLIRIEKSYRQLMQVF